MKNQDLWMPTKFVQTSRGWRGSSDAKELQISSRYSADLAAAAVDPAIRQFARGDLLDLGAGKAPWFGLYKDYVTSVTCIDWEESVHGTSHIDYTGDLNQGIPAPDGVFDTVLSTSVFEHIWKPEVLWKHVARVLRPKGRFILQVPFLYGLHEQPHDYFRYTEFALRNFARASDLKVVMLNATGGILDVLIVLLAKLLRNSYWGSRLWYQLGSQFTKSSYIQRKRCSQGEGKAYPLGYLMVLEKL